MKITPTDRITFDPGNHSYKTKDTGVLLTPVSSVLDSLEIPFDSVGKSLGVARREILAKAGLTEMPVYDNDLFNELDSQIKQRSEELQAEWNRIGQESIDFGNWIDEAVMNSVLKKDFDPELTELIEAINKEHSHYYQEFVQFVVFDEELGICGTTDRISLRGPRTDVIDITDVKTGINKGITYDGGKLENGKIKYYNKYYLEPLSHLEVCSYHRYALQLSSYAYLLQKMFGCRIGRLKICNVSRQLLAINEYTGKEIYAYKHQNIPVPYLKRDVEILFERIKTTKEMIGTSLVEKVTEDLKTSAKDYSGPSIEFNNDIIMPDY